MQTDVHYSPLLHWQVNVYTKAATIHQETHRSQFFVLMLRLTHSSDALSGDDGNITIVGFMTERSQEMIILRFFWQIL